MVSVTSGACGGDGGSSSATDDERPNLLTVFDSLPEGVQRTLSPWTGDLPEMAERRVVRVLTVYEPQYFGFDGTRNVGTVAEGAALLEEFLNDRLDTGRLPVHVIMFPVSRDLLLPFLEEGRGDIAAGGLSITPQRLERVDFGDPVATGVSEIVVTGPDVEAPDSIDDLGSIELHVRPSSSYWESLQALDQRLRDAGKPGLNLVAADEFLDDSDLLELVSSGGLPATVVYDYQAAFWSQVFPDLAVQGDLIVRPDVSLGWAVRKGSPILREALDDFIGQTGQGTMLGNVLIRRYMQDTIRVMPARKFKHATTYSELRGIFQRYGAEYDLDWVLLAAQAFQESGFDNSARSSAGAVGIMQIKPATAGDVGVHDISTPDANIHAGAAYLRHLMDQYFDDPGLDDIARQIFAIAGYNAGPARIRSLRAKTADAGLDPNKWFDNVEVLVAREVGSETTTYVANVIRYYVMFTLMREDQELRGQSAM
jgi:membrane-bound lytic murein transglycosylase MltF